MSKEALRLSKYRYTEEDYPAGFLAMLLALQKEYLEED